MCRENNSKIQWSKYTCKYIHIQGKIPSPVYKIGLIFGWHLYFDKCSVHTPTNLWKTYLIKHIYNYYCSIVMQITSFLYKCWFIHHHYFLFIIYLMKNVFDYLFKYSSVYFIFQHGIAFINTPPLWKFSWIAHVIYILHLFIKLNNDWKNNFSLFFYFRLEKMFTYNILRCFNDEKCTWRRWRCCDKWWKRTKRPSWWVGGLTNYRFDFWT